MGIVARAELEIDRPVAELFDKLVDFGRWASFMPRGFAPVSGPQRALVVGDRFVVQLGPGTRTKLEVTRLQPNREICWRGGLRGLLVGEHAFYFDALGPERTRVRSEEPFTGFVASLPGIGAALQRAASAAGRQMLLALAS